MFANDREEIPKMDNTDYQVILKFPTAIEISTCILQALEDMDRGRNIRI